MTVPALTPKPDHVPDERVVDYDYIHRLGWKMSVCMRR